MKLKDLGEFNLISRIGKKIILSKRVVKGIGDDAAVLKYKRDRFLLFTTDMLVEDRHFYKTHDPYLVGKKAMSSNISDIAAMGGLPLYCVVSIAVAGDEKVGYVDNLYRGITIAAKRFNIDVVGGNTVSSKNIIINIALLGEVEKRRLVLRSTAKEGDIIFVTGTIGGSEKSKQFNFTPRIKESRFLVKNFRINSMIDISDGLIADLNHILEASRKGAIIYEERIPISRDAKDFSTAIREGEDFELVFTISSKEANILKKKWPFKTMLSEIGKVCPKEKYFNLVKKGGKEERLKPKGYTHF